MSKVSQGLLVWCDGELLNHAVQGANGRYEMTGDVTFFRDFVCVNSEKRYLRSYFEDGRDTYSWHVWIGGSLVNILTISPLDGVYESRYVWDGLEFVIVQGRDVAMSVFDDTDVEAYVMSKLDGVVSRG